ncbi:MAG TPA: 30S ribosomal protein S20 [Elusimicrobia bacterium]|nr:MAG: 30S ribosomal protein S20 [Elusimicrobia bacterium RIFOXYA12_FULL_49_49]OGS09963.1 MAG: 30S ribosomal protein S20 [Elusimicrobia bacterium RIFOXYA1_FULL_47_7]OGS10988.1 MAG: 30S ribosomal protein S20 [Elusimicrobia bacterium RIFOXYB1_FULL_48_9]OGS15176.1 MAG: 30S ribosomal protein S20 [Elusimicrobia bacterium RIFOXYA2_FULL_47_53]OGS26954.1 MAG: 30S ribosomal protein S20 [Elusimicrobia bacterium RIFOXYB12_FULL_50_12]OGS29796.1 MAG: 30S ribosomal protein S20 [Elusimicrobia bacterium RIFO
MAKLKTGRHTSALKEHRKSKRRAAQNLSVKSKIKTLVKKVEEAVAKKDLKSAQELLRTAFSEWDKAARRNVIHKNAASNQRARLSKLVHSISK